MRDGHWYLAGSLLPVPGAGAAGPVELVVRDGTIEVLRVLDERPVLREPTVLAPLMVNAHDHGRGSGNVHAGIADAPLESWLGSLRAARATTTQESLVGDAARQMLRSGVGATVLCVNPQGPDTAAEVRAAVDAALRSGIRAAVVYPLVDAMTEVYGRPRDYEGWSRAEVEAHLEAVESIAAEVGDPRVEIQLGPVGPQWVSEPTLEAVGRHAARTGRRVHLHLLESRAQRAWADRTYPEGVLSFLERVGLLGPHVCVAHGTQLRPEEVAVLAASGSVLSLNISSNLRLASGVPPAAWALGSSLDVGAGLDGLAIADDGDYWTELRLLRGLVQAQSGSTCDGGGFLERLVRGGSGALGAAAPREPAQGALADFALLDVSGYEHVVERHGWSYVDLALAVASPERVREVWVGGRRVYAGRRGVGGVGEGSGR